MKNTCSPVTIVVLWFSLGLLFSCKSSGYQKDQGQLIGVKSGKKWVPEKPYGMTLIPSGSFTFGKSSYDQANSGNAPTRTVSVNAFFMDETEITNSEYRQFVNWVRDSIIRTALAEKVEELGGVSEGEENGIYDFAYANSPSKIIEDEDEDNSPYYEYLQQSNDDRNNTNSDNLILDWSTDLIWDTEDYPSVEYAETIETFFLPPDLRIEGEKIIDVTKLNYAYEYVDVLKAVKKKSRENIIKKNILNVYPDTAVWVKDFNYSYNEPMHKQYFWHAAYADYPVVGINWHQAIAFCKWRTHYLNGYKKSKKKRVVFEFRLPTETEWEYAARGGLENAEYPWGGPYLVDDRGCFLANFKPKRGNYLSDGAMYTSKARSYYPNQYNLYNMVGNVSEWTNSSYNEGSYYHYSTLNPNLKKNTRKIKKAIRGGSWKDVAYYLEVSSRDWEYADTSRSYIGFRTVQDYPSGRD